MRVTLTPPTSAAARPEEAIAASADCTATSEEEQAVSMATEGPRRPKA